ncbi:hypothetical protein ACFWIB_36585 [Streptomyces sp. NPDC127051]
MDSGLLLHVVKTGDLPVDQVDMLTGAGAGVLSAIAGLDVQLVPP